MPAFRRSSRRALALVLGVFFSLQALVAVPIHSLHGADHHDVQVGQHRAGGPEKGPAFPDDHCGFFLAFHALDSGSAVPPPAPCLAETAFSVVAAYASFEYSSPEFHPPARGPPSLSA
jgi:hypothetical protein